MLKFAPLLLVPALALTTVLTLLTLSGSGSGPAEAQGVNVSITQLDCDTNPEVIVVMNAGTEAIPMTGWNLQSDPTTTESLALGSLGSLPGGASVLVEAGPGATSAVKWSSEFVFRDNDPSDFAQLASDEGDVLLKVNCGSVLSQGTATATPAASRTASATPTPVATVLGSVAVPVSGGTAGAGLPLLPPLALIATGMGILLSGLATFAFPWRRGTGNPTASESDGMPIAVDVTPPTLPAASPRVARKRSQPDRPYLFLVVIVLAMVAMLAFLLQLGDAKRE
jgi:hypothetical protein